MGVEGLKHGGWTFEIDRGEEGDEYKLDETLDSEGLLLGRRTQGTEMHRSTKIAVAGATGRVGRPVVDILESRGYDVVAISRSQGVDVITGEGLDQALTGVETIIDVATGPSPDQQAATEFFTTATRNLQEAGERAGDRDVLALARRALPPRSRLPGDRPARGAGWAERRRTRGSARRGSPRRGRAGRRRRADRGDPPAMSTLAGAVVWAVVPAVPEAPFRLYAGAAHPPIELARAGKLIAAARRNADAEFTFLVPGREGPVLVLSDRTDPRLDELLAFV